MSNTAKGEFVQVAFVQDAESLDYLDSIDSLEQVATLAEYDYGAENDDAAEYNGLRFPAIPTYAHTRETEVTHGGIDYILQEDMAASYYALYRRVLD